MLAETEAYFVAALTMRKRCLISPTAFEESWSNSAMACPEIRTVVIVTGLAEEQERAANDPQQT